MRAVVFPVGSGFDNDLNFLSFPKKSAPGTCLADTSRRTVGGQESRTESKEGEDIMRNRNRVLMGLVCIVLIAAFLGCAGTHKRESSGQYVDDSVITTKVKAAVLDDPALKVLQINVETFKGVVQLSGFVDSAQSKSRAGEVAAGVKGVKSVKNDLVVK